MSSSSPPPSSSRRTTIRNNQMRLTKKNVASPIMISLLLVRSSFSHLLFASAFSSCRPRTIDTSSISWDTSTSTTSSRIVSSTALFAKKKGNKGRKIPKMPTLPVNNVADAESNDDDTTISAASTSTNAASNTSRPVSNNASTAPALSTMVVMDVENIRGATSFRISHEALLSRIKLWREDRLWIAAEKQRQQTGTEDGTSFLEPLLWVCDHGMPSSIHHCSLFSTSNDGVVNSATSYGGEDANMPHNFGVIFAGPGRSADDVIVDLVELRCSGGFASDVDAVENEENESQQQQIIQTPLPSSSRNTTIVITADAGLISRCQYARRVSSSLSDVIFVEPASLLQQLEKYRTNSIEEESLFGASSSGVGTSKYLTTSTAASGGKKVMDNGSGKNKDGKTSTMTSFRESSIASEQHAKFQARFQNRQVEGETEQTKQTLQAETTNEDEGDEEVMDIDDVEYYDDDEDHDDDDDDDETEEDEFVSNHNAVAAQLRTEQIRRHLLLSDAYYLARPSKNRGRRSHSTVAAIHAKYKTRNISKKQQKKLFEKRYGRKRKEDMMDAAKMRKELASTLQLNLLNLDGKEDTDVNGNDKRARGVKSVKGGVYLLETLLEWFEKEKILASQGLMHSVNFLDNNFGKSSEESQMHEDGAMMKDASDPTSILGLGTVGSNDKWDPLGTVLRVPLREENAEGTSIPLQPLRVVVISDTHGFEGGLARFLPPGALEVTSPSDIPHIHGDDYLLPPADVLLHCGDFAASGSRKSQRAAARRLDEFLARQTHIPEKIVVQGNHDPDSPAKTLFPNSKALYVRSSSTLVVNGVSFAMEPYSRRMAFRSVGRLMSTSSFSKAASSFPKCDVLVSHEPPRGVLDLTYHGISAGSAYLKDLVNHAKDKPRLWLCGHIHEGRGVLTHHFKPKNEQDDDNSSTMVINAANANSGRANRLVSGAVVVEIERHPAIVNANGGGDETAEGTLKIRRVDDEDDSVDPANGSNVLGLPGMEDLELYVTRPGVRRRKGVPQSMRQRMRQVRSTLITSEEE